MRTHAMRDFTMCKAALLAVLIGVGYVSLALEARGEDYAGTDAVGWQMPFDIGATATRAS